MNGESTDESMSKILSFSAANLAKMLCRTLLDYNGNFLFLFISTFGLFFFRVYHSKWNCIGLKYYNKFASLTNMKMRTIYLYN